MRLNRFASVGMPLAPINVKKSNLLGILKEDVQYKKQQRYEDQS